MLIQPARSSLAPQGNYYLPHVIEQTRNGERGYDIYSRLLKDRIIFLGTAIDDGVANAVIAQLLFLQMDDAKKDISIYVNSPGGSVTAGLADCIERSRSPDAWMKSPPNEAPASRRYS